VERPPTIQAGFPKAILRPKKRGLLFSSYSARAESVTRVHKAPGLRSIFHTFGRRQGAFPEKANEILRENQTFAAYYAMGIANSQQRRNAHEISRFPVFDGLAAGTVPHRLRPGARQERSK